MPKVVMLLRWASVGACGVALFVTWLVPAAAAAEEAGPAPTDMRPWTAWECSPSHRRLRAKEAEARQAKLAEVPASRRDAAQWASAIRAAMIAGIPVDQALDSIDTRTDDPRTVLAWVAHRREMGGQDGETAESLERLRDRAEPGEVAAYVAAAVHAAEWRDLGDRVGDDDLRRMRELATALSGLPAVPETVLSHAAAMAELAAADPGSRDAHMAEALAALGRLDSIGDSISRVSRTGEPFGIAAGADDTLFVVVAPDAPTSRGDDLARVSGAVLGRSLPGIRPERIVRVTPAGLPALLTSAMAGTPAPARIVLLRSGLGGGVRREDRLLGDGLADRGIRVHVVAFVPDPAAVTDAAAAEDAAFELARRSRGSIRAIGDSILGETVASTSVDRWKRREMWGPVHDRQRAAVELAISALGGPAPRDECARAALAPLSPDPVASGVDVGDSCDWQSLALAGVAAGAERERADRLQRAATVLVAQARGADEDADGPSDRGIRERAARMLLLRSLARRPDLGDAALDEGLRLADELEVVSGTWSGRLLGLATGWAASVRASRSIDPSMPDAALRQWELAAVEHLFRGGPPPPPRPPGAELSAWESIIFEDCLRESAESRRTPQAQDAP